MHSEEIRSKLSFQQLTLESFYEGWGDEITQVALLPILRESVAYDRISSYFSIESMLAIAEGIEGIWRKGGRIRLIMGLHDLNAEILFAHATSQQEDFDNVLSEIKSRIISQVSRLEDEIARNKIHTFASMLKEGFLEIKIAAHPSGPGQAIFHNKRFIFKDNEGNLITGSSGMNETVRGLTRNYDDLTLQRSWIDKGTQLNSHIQSFEKLWTGNRSDLIIKGLDNEFAFELEEQSRPKVGIAESQAPSENSLADLLANSNEYFFQSMSQVALFPHQERVVQEALSELPVRKMLADEVGLGKTLEAGAIIHFLSSRLSVSKICIACPQGLMRQWRDEMTTHFGLDFWLWDSSSGEYESSTGQRVAPSNGMPFGSSIPDRVIVSSHLLRTKRQREHIQNLSNLTFDLFLLDEAHAARMTKNSSGRITKTKLWSIAKQFADSATHALLLTATPMQMSFVELFGQLDLLGLRGNWADPVQFEMSVEALSGIKKETTLDQCRVFAKLLIDSLRELQSSKDLTQAELEFLEYINNTSDSLDQALLIDQNLDLTYEILLKVHPAHKLVIRNTRDSLVAMGYKFPERIHLAPELKSQVDLSKYFRELEAYLRDSYGRVEKAISPDKSWSSGFAASGYYQRLASSLVASRATLNRRLHRLLMVTNQRDNYSKSALTQVPFDDDEYIDDEPEEQLQSEFLELIGNPQKARHVLQAAQVEISALQSLINTLDSLSPDLGEVDPKFEEAKTQILNHSNSAPVLVFSKYTDTLDGLLSHLQTSGFLNNLSGFGYYSGKEVWLEYEGTRLPANKNEVVKALFNGQINLLLCSDAASEGLNLQAAATIINIDVPWNPARLEQRIGRVDRLGQKQPKVQIINLWYPNSVEAKIYQRLLSRKDQLELAVGKYPSLIAKSIADSVGQRFGLNSELPETNDLELYRDRVQELALSKLWGNSSSDLTQSRKIRKESFNFLQESNATRSLVQNLVLEEGFPNTFCILHRNLQTWWASVSEEDQNEQIPGLFGLLIDNRLTRFVLESENRLYLLSNEVLSQVIEAILDSHYQVASEFQVGIDFNNDPDGVRKMAIEVLSQAKLPLGSSDDVEIRNAYLVPINRKKQSVEDKY